MKLLLVVHRYWPFPGGSEYATKRLADAAVKRGHDVSVFTEQGNSHDNVFVTNDPSILLEKFDLIWVHGSMTSQDMVHSNSEFISKTSNIFYQLVQPKDTEIVKLGMKNAKYIGWSTSADVNHILKYGYSDKMKKFIYSIDERQGVEGFKNRHGIATKEMFISTGGFWAHKGFEELIKAFREAARPDCTLVLTGYDTRFHPVPQESEFVKVIVEPTFEDVQDGLFEADLYIMNSTDEGFGLTILESMYHETPWVARDIAIAHDLEIFGYTYKTYDELVTYLRQFKALSKDVIQFNKNWVMSNHLPIHTIRSLEDLNDSK